jgi:hypothetical protein
MNVSPTQAESFRAMLPKMPAVKQRVLDVLAEYAGPLSRESIALLSGMRLATVCSAVHGLMKDGALADAGTTYNHETRRNVQVVKLAGAKLTPSIN